MQMVSFKALIHLINCNYVAGILPISKSYSIAEDLYSLTDPALS